MLLDLLSSISIFGFAALLVALVMFYSEHGSEQREGLADQQKDAELKRFGASYSVVAVRRVSLLIAVGGGCLALVATRNVVFAAVPMVVGLLIPIMYPWRVKRAYFTRFESDFAECLDIWTRCLTSGLSFQQAIDTAGNDLKGPVSREMETLKNEISFGDVDSALWRLHERVPIDDVKYAVLGVITCRQTGGKMSEVMANISESIRERQAQRQRIMAITSMGRTEAYVMAAMPFAIGFIMYLLEPASVSLLFSTTFGIIGTFAAIAWESLGLLIIWKIVDIKA
ncbi:MAG: type II secretion system F family protein [Planctomycetes bacterium]|nr:type II secretion system F family protein [Planctomycetota bacterium]